MRTFLITCGTSLERNAKAAGYSVDDAGLEKYFLSVEPRTSCAEASCLARLNFEPGDTAVLFCTATSTGGRCARVIHDGFPKHSGFEQPAGEIALREIPDLFGMGERFSDAHLEFGKLVKSEIDAARRKNAGLALCPIGGTKPMAMMMAAAAALAGVDVYYAREDTAELSTLPVSQMANG
jgi:putative CRISPR-associated protein (TIGR02619 family)